jgi:uncharacterized protein YdhG (YjbR/CyaY superfamily)
MAEKKPTKKKTQPSATTSKTSGGFTAEERAAMKERAREQKAEARWRKDRAAGEEAVFAKFAEMPGPERTMAKRLHVIIQDSAPDLMPRTWYGMPAYANKDGKVVCYFTPASKFKERYSTFGFNATANLDDGAMWPTSFALLKPTDAEEKKIVALVKKAVR